jgi:aryl-alcohol dehydrogenase-like predicted oxidoreductase
LIGTYIGPRGDEFFLVSKCGCPIEFPADVLPPCPHDYSPGNVRANVEQSLRRLRKVRFIGAAGAAAHGRGAVLKYLGT